MDVRVLCICGIAHLLSYLHTEYLLQNFPPVASENWLKTLTLPTSINLRSQLWTEYAMMRGVIACNEKAK